MIRAYDKVYLGNARAVLARMLDFAVYDLKFDIEEFFGLFISSGVGTRFEEGDYEVLAGKSGVELAYEVLDCAGKEYKRIKPQYTVERSEEYWTGHVLAYYQWHTALRFSEIVKYISIKDIRDLYSPYHEMDIRQFVDKMNEMYRKAKPDTNLKLLRQQAGLTQKELAEICDIPIRTIQQYEQRQKNINKAQVEYLVVLSKELGCEVTALLEIY